MSRTYATDRAEAPPHKIPIHLSREPHQRMAWIDELLQRRLKQIVLTIVARLAHGLPPTANLAIEGIMGRQNRESPKARKPHPTPSFLAESNTGSAQISPIDQAFQNSSRATSYSMLFVARGHGAREICMCGLELPRAFAHPTRVLHLHRCACA